MNIVNGVVVFFFHTSMDPNVRKVTRNMHEKSPSLQIRQFVRKVWDKLRCK